MQFIELLNLLSEEGNKNEELTNEEIDKIRLVMECLESDTQKVNKLGNLINEYAQENEFTYFEVCSLCCSIIMSVCAHRIEGDGLDYTTKFATKLVTTLNKGLDEIFKEAGERNESCKTEDCSCKFE